MYQSGYLESDLWDDGFIDPHAWLVSTSLPDITSGSYDPSTLTITANGQYFFFFQGTGALYYRKDGGAWIPAPLYLSWSNTQIIIKIPVLLAFGTYDLKIVRSDTNEDTLAPAFEITPLVSSTYYVDSDQSATGAGTAANPWNLAQLKAYFNDDVGYFPMDGDIIMVKGDIPESPGDAYLFNVNIGNGKTIIMKAWDKSTNGLYTVSTTYSGFDIFRIASGTSDVTLDIQDMVILQQNVSGPTADHLIIVKSLDNTVDVNEFIMRNCMIISEKNVHMTGASAGEITNIKMYGSNISFGVSAILYINEYADTTLIYDSAIDLKDGASISKSTGDLTWEHCEFNRSTSSIPGTKTDCTFDNSLLERLPTNIDANFFFENDFNYYIYGISNAGSGAAFWAANSIQYDIKGYARAGIGAFRFESNTYYVDGEKTVSGTGVEINQFTFNQFRNYFCESLGVACGVDPTGYDTFLLKNIFTPIDNFFLRIHKNIGGYVIIKAQNIGSNKAWFIETKESAGV